MHMRSAEPTFTDTMHGLLAINPFILLTVAVAAVTFRRWFRWYSVFTAALMVAGAALSFSHVGQLLPHQPTPGLGTLERAAQYGHQLWHAVLAIVLLREPFLNLRDHRAP